MAEVRSTIVVVLAAFLCEAILVLEHLLSGLNTVDSTEERANKEIETVNTRRFCTVRREMKEILGPCVGSRCLRWVLSFCHFSILYISTV